MSAAVLLLLLSAPAPLPRPAPPPPALVPASVRMQWHGITAETHFHADGTYACLWVGTWWEGRWAQKGGVVTVEEWITGPRPPDPLRWSVTLTSPTDGKMGSGAVWRVWPLGGGKIG